MPSEQYSGVNHLFRHLLPLLALSLLTGCNRNFFHAQGQIAAEGPAFGQWAGTPQGCSRDPIDALPDFQTATIASFFWENPADHNAMLRDHRMAHVPDFPEQLNLLRARGGGYDVRLKTVETTGTLIHAQDCSTFQIETQEQDPSFKGGRSSLAGRVKLECRVRDSRVWADFSFTRCDF